MKVVMGVNEEVSRYLKRKKGEKIPGYRSAVELYREFEKRGHDVYIVHPSQLIDVVGKKGFENLFKMKDKDLIPVKKNYEVDADVFFVRGYCADHPDKNKAIEFLNALYDVENQVKFLLNSAESNSYSYKPKQKTLDLPFVPNFEVKNKSDLESLLDQGKKIIAKPNFGYQSIGVTYLDSKESLNLISDLSNYCYEEFIPEQLEKRYVFLNNKIVAKRIWERKGVPGKEKKAKAYINQEYNKKELEIVKKVIDMTGMFYGCVDFRNNYILEINGSGTGTVAIKRKRIDIIYNITSLVVDEIEKELDRR